MTTTGTRAAAGDETHRRRRLAVVAVSAGALVLAAVAALATAGGAPAGSALPGELAGLPAQGTGPAQEVADQLTDRLAAEPSVSDTAVGVYGEPGSTLVVLRLTPHDPLTDSTAGRLVARVLGAAGAERGLSEDVESVATTDGLALVTCSRPQPGAATCVSVESDTALVVLTTGATMTDPLDLTQTVRDELRAGRP